MNYFKDYCINHWKNKDIEDRCLYLQNTYQVTVVTILYAMWCDDNAVAFNPLVIDFAKEYEADTIIPLRTLRKTLDKGTPAHNEAISLEIQEELALIQKISDNFTNQSSTEKNAVATLSEILKVDINLK